MKLLTAIVTSVFDPLDPTMIHCSIIGSDEDGSFSEPVLYTSPCNRSQYLEAGGAGLTAYPSRGDLVLIAKADNDSSYFYMSTVTGATPEDLEKGIRNYPSDKNIATLDTNKKSLSLRDNVGGVVEFVDKSNNTSRRSYVKISDGPDNITLNRQYQNESIHLRTRGGDTQIRMNGPRKFSGVDHGPGSLLVQGERNTVLKSKKGNVRIEAAAEARSIMIKNNAQFIGMNVSNATDPFSGQITLESLYNQICLRTYGYGQNSNPNNGIFFQAGLTPIVATPDASVPATGGVIQSHAANTNNMLCGTGAGFGISMNGATGRMTIQAPAGININTGGDLNINGTAVNLQLPSNEYPGAEPTVPRPTNLDAQPPVPGAG
jgi:hypothetical protein